GRGGGCRRTAGCREDRLERERPANEDSRADGDEQAQRKPRRQIGDRNPVVAVGKPQRQERAVGQARRDPRAALVTGRPAAVLDQAGDDEGTGRTLDLRSKRNTIGGFAVIGDPNRTVANHLVGSENESVLLPIRLGRKRARWGAEPRERVAGGPRALSGSRDESDLLRRVQAREDVAVLEDRAVAVRIDGTPFLAGRSPSGRGEKEADVQEVESRGVEVADPLELLRRRIAAGRIEELDVVEPLDRVLR